MSREVKRVDTAFRWFEDHPGEVWWGYTLDPIPCRDCGATGGAEGHRCGTCCGDGEFYPNVNPPSGRGWQMWETTSDGSPISPVFDTPEELARWLADNKASAFGRETATYEEWLHTIQLGYAVSAVLGPRGLESGVVAQANDADEETT